MSRAFNAVMRVISSLIGVLMVLMGGIWIVQGLNLAWGSLSRSFMQGDQHWVFYGAIMLSRSVSGCLEQHPSTGMRSVHHTGDRTEDSSGLFVVSMVALLILVHVESSYADHLGPNLRPERSEPQAILTPETLQVFVSDFGEAAGTRQIQERLQT